MPLSEDPLAARLTALRQKQGWTLEDLAGRSGISRASLSRIERGDVSPTAQVLGRLAAAYRMPMQALFAEDTADEPLVPAARQPVWTDPETGFIRRTLSPTQAGFRGTVIEGLLPAGQTITYSTPPLMELEHHLVLLEGALDVTLGAQTHMLSAGDCLRFRLTSSNAYHASGPRSARYILTVIQP